MEDQLFNLFILMVAKKAEMKEIERMNHKSKRLVNTYG